MVKYMNDYTDKTTRSMIGKVNSQLEENASLFKDSKRAKIGINIKWLPSHATIDKWVANGIEEITFIPLIKYTVESADWSIYTNLTNAKEILNYAYSKGMKVVCIKIHSCNETSESDQTEVESNLENFKTKYKQYMLDIYNSFKDEPFMADTKYFCVLNEKEYMYSNAASYETFILDLLNTMKGYGFKVGVSSAGIYLSVKKLSDNAKNAVDCFFVNEYPCISFKGSKTTIGDSISAWNSMQHISALEHLKSYNREIILSETGVVDYYEYLASPSSYTWDTGSLTPSVDGDVGIIYMGGLLQSKAIKYFSSVWMMFEDTFIKPDVKVYFDKYKGGAL